MGISPVSVLLGVIIGWLAHFFTSQRASVYVGVIVVILCEVAFSIALQYYGFTRRRQATSPFQKATTLFFLLLIVLILFQAFKDWHVID